MNVLRPDVDFGGDILTVTGKGERTRRVPMSATLRGALLELRDAGRGRGPVLGGIGAAAIRARMRRLAARATVGYLGFHSLRHHTGTQLARAGLQDRDIAGVLGHANIKTVAIYRKWSDDEAKSVLATW